MSDHSNPSKIPEYTTASWLSNRPNRTGKAGVDDFPQECRGMQGRHSLNGRTPKARIAVNAVIQVTRKKEPSPIIWYLPSDGSSLRRRFIVDSLGCYGHSVKGPG